MTAGAQVLISLHSRHLFLSRPFFSLACLHAAVMAPLAALVMITGTGPVALNGAGHGLEMLFGLVPLLIAGYLLGPTRPITIALFLAFWLLARACRLAATTPFLVSWYDPIPGLILAAMLLPRLRHARRWRNRLGLSLAPALCLSPLLFLIAETPPTSPVLLLAGLLAFMGGRVIAPLAAMPRTGKNERRGPGVQPMMEGGLLIALLFAWATAPQYSRASAPALLLAGVLVWIRGWRWRLWQRPRADLALLGLGYGWLGLGLLTLAWSHWIGQSTTNALHLITVGALGCLSCGVMIRLRHRLDHRSPLPWRWVLPIGLSLSLAASARVIATPSDSALLVLSASTWSAAYLLVLFFLLRRPGSCSRS